MCIIKKGCVDMKCVQISSIALLLILSGCSGASNEVGSNASTSNSEVTVTTEATQKAETPVATSDEEFADVAIPVELANEDVKDLRQGTLNGSYYLYKIRGMDETVTLRDMEISVVSAERMGDMDAFESERGITETEPDNDFVVVKVKIVNHDTKARTYTPYQFSLVSNQGSTKAPATSLDKTTEEEKVVVGAGEETVQQIVFHTFKVQSDYTLEYNNHEIYVSPDVFSMNVVGIKLDF